MSAHAKTMPTLRVQGKVDFALKGWDGMRPASGKNRRRAPWRSRGQTLVIVALLLPLLVLVMALVIDVVNVTIQRQRLAGAAQLAADAGATIASRDVYAILLKRHDCQASISYASWDTTPCASHTVNGTDPNLVNLNQDCPWIFQSQQFDKPNVSDSTILAQCLDMSPSRYTGWWQAASTNLDHNGSASDQSTPVLSCDGLCGGSPSGSANCYNARIICVEVSVTTHVTAPVVGVLTSASTSLTIQTAADASVSLPGTCGALKSLILNLGGDCPAP